MATYGTGTYGSGTYATLVAGALEARTASDSLGTTDAATRVVVLTRTAADTLGTTDRAYRAVAAQPYKAAVLADGPALYWRLDETTGTAIADSSGNSRGGTTAGTPTLNAAGALVGDPNAAVDFDGVDDVVTATYAPYQVGSVRTFEGWAWRDTSTSHDSLIGSPFGTGFNNRPHLLLATGSNNVQFSANENFGDRTWTNAWPGDAQWVHWALIYDDSRQQAELFINGTSKGIVTPQATYSTANFGRAFQIGRRRGDTDYFDGKIDEVAVYEYGLPAHRIRAHYAAGRATADPYSEVVMATGPSLYWRLGERSGTTAYDISGNVRDGTYSGVTLGQPGAVRGADTAVAFVPASNSAVSNATYNPFVNGTIRTFQGWAYRDDTSDEHTLFSSLSGSAPRLMVLSGLQWVWFSSQTGTYDHKWNSNVFPTAAWTHWALVFDEPNDVAELFINGVSQGTQTVAGSTYTASPGAFQVGRRANVTYAWKGRQDEFAIYERALTPAEITRIYQAGSVYVGRSGVTRDDISPPVNLLTNPSFEGDAIGAEPAVWTKYNLGGGAAATSALVVADSGAQGAQALEIVYGGTASYIGIVQTLAGDFKAGQTYELSTYLKSISGSLNFFVLRVFGGGVTADKNFSITTSWGRHSVYWTPRVDASTVDLRIFSLAGAAQTFRIDGIMFGVAGAPTYFDGSTPGFAWTGTAHASSSTRPSDTAIAGVVRARSAVDTLGTTDTATRGPLFLPRTAADTLGTTDSAVGARMVIRTAVDTLGTTDTATRGALTRTRTAADSLSTSDIASRSPLVRGRTAADSLATTDVATRGPLTRTRTANDTLGTSDIATRGPLSRTRTAADSLGTSDVATRGALSRVRTAADALGTTDTATRTTTRPRTAADTLGTTDTADRSLGRARTATDALGTTDAAVVTYRESIRTAVDLLGTTDVAVSIASKVRTAADTLGTVDVATRQLGRLRLAEDTLGTTDAAVVTYRRSIRLATDVLGTTDVATRAPLSRARTTTDVLGTTDTASRAPLSRVRTAADSLGTTDTASRGPLFRSRTAVDVLGTADIATRAPLSRVRTATDVLGTTDTATRAPLSRVRVAADSLGTTDTASRASFFRSRTAVDALGTTDEAVRAPLVRTRTAVDTLGTTDEATRFAPRFRTAGDVLGTTDTATRLAPRFRTAVDVLGTADIATRAPLTRTRTAQDTLGTTDVANRAPLSRARIAVDLLGTTDTAVRAPLSRVRLATDLLGTSDVATRTADRFRVAVDLLGTTDTAERASLLVVRTAVDVLGTSDVVTQTGQKARVAFDVLATTDTASRAGQTFYRVAFDFLETTDAATRQLGRARFANDTLGTTDEVFVTTGTPTPTRLVLRISPMHAGEITVRATHRSTMNFTDIAGEVVVSATRTKIETKPTTATSLELDNLVN